MRLVLTIGAALVSASALAQAPAPAPQQSAAQNRGAAQAPAYDEKVTKARALLKANDARAALAASQEAIALDDKRWEGYVTAAGAYSAQSLYDDAIGMLQAALTRAPEDRKPAIRDALAETRRALSAAPPSAAVPGTAPAASAPTQAEIVLWKSIENSRNASDFSAYLEKYPDGTFAPVAKARRATLIESSNATPRSSLGLSADDPFYDFFQRFDTSRRAKPPGGDAERRPSSVTGTRLGLTVRPLTAEEHRDFSAPDGVMVEASSGPAAKAGLMPGDVIVRSGSATVSSPDQLRSLLDARPRSPLLVIRKRSTGVESYFAVMAAD